MSKKLCHGFWLGIQLLSILSLSGCDLVYRALHKEGAEEKELLGELIPYKANAKAMEVQQLLKLYGYNPGRLDGKFGVNSRNAVAKFQEDQGLEVTRFVDQATWNRLHAFEDSGLVREGKINVSRLQVALKNSGFELGRADGKMGPQTQAAIQAFQRRKGLKADGEVGFETLSIIEKHIPQLEAAE